MNIKRFVGFMRGEPERSKESMEFYHQLKEFRAELKTDHERIELKIDRVLKEVKDATK